MERETLDANPDYSFLELRVSHIIADLIMCQKSTFSEDRFNFIKKTLKLPRAPNLPEAHETTLDFGGLQLSMNKAHTILKPLI